MNLMFDNIWLLAKCDRPLISLRFSYMERPCDRFGTPVENAYQIVTNVLNDVRYIIILKALFSHFGIFFINYIFFSVVSSSARQINATVLY